MPLRPRSVRFRSSFQYRLFRVFTLISALVSIFFCTLYIVTEIRSARTNISAQLRMQARYLGDAIRLPLYAENREVLNQVAAETVKLPEIRSVVIIAADGKVLAESRDAGLKPSDDIFTETVMIHSNPLGSAPETALSGGSDEGALIGGIRIERGSADLNRTIYSLVAISTGIAVGFWLLVSLVGFLSLRQVTRSFNTLMSGIYTMKDGDFTSRINVTTDDEPGLAATAINELADALQQRSEENSRLQEERLNLERQILHSQKLESLGIMAGGIAHDYNNLLQAILGNIELAARNLAPDSAALKFIENAVKSGKHAAQLTHMMLTYVGKGLITKTELDLNKLVRENTDILKTTVLPTVSVKLDLSPDLPPIYADEANIQQVVMNLIINATESIEVPPGVVNISTGIQNCDQACLAGSLLGEKPEPGRFVFLEIRDNGCGMSEETIHRLFDPFFTTKFTGRGLGLSATMGIIRMHGGALFVESKIGAGTTFRVLFPASATAATAPVTITEPVSLPPEPAAVQEQPLSGMALVVDDEKQVLKICRKMVELCGFTVITACDGLEAVARFREHADEISFVLLDLTMPNMDGITAMGEIFTINPDAKVIISSGFSEDELHKHIADHAPSGFIRKPYNMATLQTELRRILPAG